MGSPLDDPCSPNPSGSAKSAVAAWTAAGFPADQIVLGVLAYNHSFSVPSSTAAPNGQIQLYTSFSAAKCSAHSMHSTPFFFTTPDLSDIARNLDAMEYSYNRKSNSDEGSMNMDDTGYFSVQVLESALNVFGLSLLRWRSEAARPYRDKPQYVHPAGSTDICGNPQSANGVFNFWALVGRSSMIPTRKSCSPMVTPSHSGQYISQAGLCGFAMYKVGGDYNNMLISTINTATSL
ncbi:hypothetical protein EDD15DRAFT_2414362 [Pisolithus albus]|nr:hypothetical protein EDD15DRAFT_2414362 [Pisolithus albus]